MTKCIDRNLGSLLPAYELSALSEEDEKRLEIHLMQCEHCFSEVAAFGRFAEVLRDSTRIKEAVSRHIGPAQRATSGRSVWRYLWPDVPLVFRPALGMLLVLLMVIPTLVGLRVLTDDSADIRPVQMIRLIPTRSAGVYPLSIGSGLDAAISFAAPEYAPGRLYDVAIVDDQGEEVVRLDSFGSIDERGMGQIIFPNRAMKAGLYHLIVTRFDSESTASEHRYAFGIEP
jgi:hypothetical protein